jgi:hypothetical protein
VLFVLKLRTARGTGQRFHEAVGWNLALDEVSLGAQGAGPRQYGVGEKGTSVQLYVCLYSKYSTKPQCPSVSPVGGISTAAWSKAGAEGGQHNKHRTGGQARHVASREGEEGRTRLSICTLGRLGLLWSWPEAQGLDRILGDGEIKACRMRLQERARGSRVSTVVGRPASRHPDAQQQPRTVVETSDMDLFDQLMQGK